MAVLLLVALAIVVRPGPARAPARGGSNPGQVWAAAVAPRLAALEIDIAMVGPGGAPPAEEARLRRDLAAARSVGPAPRPAWTAEWDGALGRIATAATLLGSDAGGSGGRSAASAAYRQLQAAGDVLLALAQQVGPPLSPVPA